MTLKNKKILIEIRKYKRDRGEYWTQLKFIKRLKIDHDLSKNIAIRVRYKWARKFTKNCETITIEIQSDNVDVDIREYWLVAGSGVDVDDIFAINMTAMPNNSIIRFVSKSDTKYFGTVKDGWLIFNQDDKNRAEQ